jgi:hypothetical protein
MRRAHSYWQRKSISRLLCLFLALLNSYSLLFAQSYLQSVKGTLLDQESRQPIPEVILMFSNQKAVYSAFTDSQGNFKIKIPTGRWDIQISHLGYGTKVLQNIQVGTGKEVMLEITLEAKVFETGEVEVSAGKKMWLTPSSGSSVRTLQSQDASRFAGGYYDPLRMVANFAGVTSGNSDESNEIVVRGNSPRGISWRLEGLEIPNPNHLSNGVGNNGGAYSMISTNVLADFDFYTGAFPAEFGNALSGVMDLRLRKGNTDRHEFGLQLSVVGAEVAAEGPIGKSSGNSYLFNLRYANFDILKKYGIVAIQDLSIIPSSLDWTFKMNFHGSKLGELEIFSIGGNSKAGNEPSQNREDILKRVNNDEFLEEDALAVFGLKHLKNFKDGKTYLRTIIGFTRSEENWHEGVLDTAFVHIVNKQDWMISPVLRSSVMLNRKVNAKNSFRMGFEYHSSFPDMFSIRRQSNAKYDTLVNQRSKSFYTQAYFQWKYKPSDSFELIPSLHSTFTSINKQFTFEPRLGMVFHLPGSQSVNFGTGFYSKQEPLPVYYFRVKTTNAGRKLLNNDLKTTKAFHLVVGYRKSFSNDLRVSIETYFQHLYNVPVSQYTNNTFSMVNMSEGLPDIDLSNKGISENFGIELTLDKSFAHNYYLLATISLFDSKYMASSTNWYSTYYNSNFVFNFLLGREFKVGKFGQNSLGFNLRNIARGGYRFTPPNYSQSILKKTVIYDVQQTYGKHLPFFDRMDAGVNYRINRKNSAFNFSLDIQNVLNRHNVYKRNFSYSQGAIVETDRKLIGLVPIAGIRFDF